MQVMVDAIFTGTEPDSIQILIAGVEGGKTEANLIPIICPENQPVRGKVMFFVQPPVAKEGKPWRGRIVLVDQYNRKFRSPKLTLENR